MRITVFIKSLIIYIFVIIFSSKSTSEMMFSIIIMSMSCFTEKGKEWLHHVRSRDATRNYERESGRFVRRDQSTRWHEGKPCRFIYMYVVHDVL